MLNTACGMPPQELRSLVISINFALTFRIIASIIIYNTPLVNCHLFFKQENSIVTILSRQKFGIMGIQNQKWGCHNLHSCQEIKHVVLTD